MKSTNTGKYRICRDKLGVSGIPQLEFNNRKEAEEAKSKLRKDSEWTYYIGACKKFCVNGRC